MMSFICSGRSDNYAPKPAQEKETSINVRPIVVLPSDLEVEEKDGGGYDLAE